jgi:hypothetical protein
MLALALTLWFIIVGVPAGIALWWLLSLHEQRHPCPHTNEIASSGLSGMML